MFSNVLYSVFKVQSRYLSVSMGLSGLEPPTSRLSGVRSNRLSYKPPRKNEVFPSRITVSFDCDELLVSLTLILYYIVATRIALISASQFSLLRGDGEIRTLDPLLARQVLSQLSYTPIKGYFTILF